MTTKRVTSVNLILTAARNFHKSMKKIIAMLTVTQCLPVGPSKSSLKIALVKILRNKNKQQSIFLYWTIVRA